MLGAHIAFSWPELKPETGLGFWAVDPTNTLINESSIHNSFLSALPKASDMQLSSTSEPAAWASQLTNCAMGLLQLSYHRSNT